MPCAGQLSTCVTEAHDTITLQSHHSFWGRFWRKPECPWSSQSAGAVLLLWYLSCPIWRQVNQCRYPHNLHLGVLRTQEQLHGCLKNSNVEYYGRVMMLLSYFLIFYFLRQYFSGENKVTVILEFVMLLESTGHESALRQENGQDELVKYLSRPISTSLWAEQNELKMFSQKWQIKEAFLWILHKLNMNKMNPTSGPFLFFIFLKNRYNNTISAHKN